MSKEYDEWFASNFDVTDSHTRQHVADKCIPRWQAEIHKDRVVAEYIKARPNLDDGDRSMLKLLQNDIDRHLRMIDQTGARLAAWNGGAAASESTP